MKQRHPIVRRDYSNAFLVAILIGVAVVVIALMMALDRATSRSPENVGQTASSISTPHAAELTNNVSGLFSSRWNNADTTRLTHSRLFIGRSRLFEMTPGIG